MSEFENDFGEDGDEPEWCAVGGIIKAVTKMAVGVEVERGKELLWLPKSQIEGLNGIPLEKTAYGFNFVRGMSVHNVLLPAWLCRRNGLR